MPKFLKNCLFLVDLKCPPGGANCPIVHCSGQGDTAHCTQGVRDYRLTTLVLETGFRRAWTWCCVTWRHVMTLHSPAVHHQGSPLPLWSPYEMNEGSGDGAQPVPSKLLWRVVSFW